MTKIPYVLGILIMTISCTSEKADSEVTFIDPSPRGYSQSVVHATGDTKVVYISGQVSVDSTGKVVGVGNLKQQTEQVFKNIAVQVEKAGGTMNDIVKINCYFTDITEVELFRTARDRYINLERPPASTAVQVERLINEDFLIEIDATAVIQ